ncbi:hypothetical protein FisN_UnNu022 [Fistulifera solaris]|uniref:Uncharacterized protein n=1 Tax=Fistulifera solaris TaxID=1519565 RepID=A0A1Z5JAD5_FISSO|nr:hypothetical protein FisN_UnNu022 [Fistulifera solaris]|eukprot:GAX10919.1 hypothetical protein FisN_UnNu022 [Fistulifera solaris]
MPKKNDNDDDVDANLPKWGEGTKGWHTLIFMLSKKMISVESKSAGGQGPAEVRAMSPLFKYKLANFTANLDKIRKNWNGKKKEWLKILDTNEVDPEILAKAGAAGNGGNAGNEGGGDDDDDDDNGDAGLGDLDNEFGGMNLDPEGDAEKKATPKKDIKKPDSEEIVLPNLVIGWMGSNQAQNLTVIARLPAGALRTPAPGSGLKSYVTAYIENSLTATIAIDVTDDTIHDPIKFYDKFWGRAKFGTEHVKVVGHHTAVRLLKNNNPRKRIIKKCRIQLPFEVELQWNPDIPTVEQLVMLKIGVDGSQEQYVVMEMKEALAKEFKSHNVSVAWDTCYDDEPVVATNDGTATGAAANVPRSEDDDEGDEMDIDRDPKKRKSYVAETDRTKNLRDFVDHLMKGVPVETVNETDEKEKDDGKKTKTVPIGQPKDGSHYKTDTNHATA